MIKRTILSLIIAMTMDPGKVDYRGWRWKYISKTRRMLDHNRCARCHNSWWPLNVHHKKHVADSGGHMLWNLITLCHACHEAVHGREF